MLRTLALTAAFGSLIASDAFATLVSIDGCPASITCQITSDPVAELGGIVTANPNDNRLLAWDEVQNFTLTADLRVDRVFDETADFVMPVGTDFLIKAGTVVSSHYLQYDGPRFQATVTLDSEIFAFITADQNLFDSDAQLGLLGLDYNDFTFRGLEAGDTTTFDGNSTAINWATSSPGDWTRLITAFSPGGEDDMDNVSEVPLPATLPLLVTALVAAAGAARRPRT